MTILGRLLLFLSFTLAAPVVAQVPDELVTNAVASEPSPDQRIAELERRNDELRYGLDIARIHVDLVDRQTSWFSILISAFALVVTGVVLYFAFSFGRQGVREATAAAVEAARDEAKTEAVTAATSAIDKERRQVEALLKRAEEDLERFAPLLEKARSSLSEIEKEKARAKKLSERLNAAEPPKDEATRKEVKEVAETSSKKRKKDRTPSDFKVLYSLAQIKDDWAEALKQAQAMEAWLDDDADEEDIAFALFGQAFALGKLDKREKAIEAYDRLIARFGDSDAPALQKQVAGALVNKGASLGMLNRPEEALSVCDEVLNRIGDSDAPALQKLLASALVSKGASLAALNRREEALCVCDEVESRFDDSDAPALQKEVAKALVNKGANLGALNRYEEALCVYDEVLSRFGDSDAPALQQRVANALFNKACAYALVENVAFAIEALTQWRDRLEAFDCEKVANDADFDKIRDHPDFRKFLQDNGCDCGPPPPDAPVEADPDTPDPPEGEEPAGPGSD